MECYDLMSEELGRIRKILTLAFGEEIQRQLTKTAVSDTWKKIWVLMDGTRHIPEIAAEVGTDEYTVTRFLKILVMANLARISWGHPPQRTVDYIPPAWISLIELQVNGPEPAEP